MKQPTLPALILSAVSLVTALVPYNASASSNGGQAAVKLLNASATISQTSDTDWTLKKTGEVDSSTVTWTITATEGSTVSGHLVVYGFITVANTGAKPATVGNIVVNLQSKWGSTWETQSSDIADATHGDNATTAYIDAKASSENQGQFSTNSASGKLDFMDANDNTVFSLEPQKTIAPGASVNLLFSAGFDNNTLKLSDGEAVRAEVIVSFGNSTSNAPSAANVDINGNGQIDQDEAWVRSVPARLTMAVPEQIAANQSVTLTDTASDIATTGTATFSNPTFNLGTTSGTVMVNYDGGASGGKLTNCAHLKSASSTVTVGSYKFPNVNGIDLQACDTETITANSSVTAGWNNGDVTTYDQSAWGDNSTNAASILTTNLATVYASTLGLVEVGIPGSTGFSMQFETAIAVINYLPSIGAPAALDADLLDPSTSNSGQFGGDVLALKLNVDLSDAGDLTANSGLKFGDLTICGFTDLTALNGTSVRSFLGTVNTLLGGGSSTYTIAQLDPITIDLNNSFSGGTVSTWAQEHLFNGACPVWKSGDIVAYDQIGWDADPTASTLLTNHFLTFYGGSSLLIGSTYFLAFSDAAAVLSYLPASGAAFPLVSSLADPTDTRSGAFGGNVLALQLDVDFSDGSILSANSGLKFGDLTMCGLTTTNNGVDVSSLNGTTVRELLALDNTGLGGGSASVSVTGLNDLTLYVTGAFDGLDLRTSDSGWGGVPDKWAQQHLRNGACQ